MVTTRSDPVELLERILTLPTAPFHEGFVSALLCRELEIAGFDFRLDNYGNIIVSCGEGDNPLACVAHMDHPGFEILEGGEGVVEAEWFGGVDGKYFPEARVVIYEGSSGAVRARGRVEEVSKNDQGRVEKMRLRIKGVAARGDFGSWNLVPFRQQGELIYTKGADDLVGCAVILTALKEIKRKGVKKPILGIFTRAEEQGFIGTLGMIRARALPASARIVSIETSKALPGIRLGGGPVIRLGDRTSMFNHQMVVFMDYVAREIKRKDSDFIFQRRVMDGGTCEATPYQWSGYASGGIAVPLRNYHNQGRKRIGPEGIHLGDVEGAIRLLVELALRTDEFDLARQETVQRWEGLWEKYGSRLLRT